MNTIIIPTDFSPSAENAMHYGARLAQHIGASVLIVHVYTIPISMNDVPVMTLTTEELKKSADEGLERCRRELEAKYEGLVVRVEGLLGDIEDEVNELCKEHDPFAIVIGSQRISGIERFLFGSTSLSLIRHTNYPVIAVPEDYASFSINNIVLAADLEGSEHLPVERIKSVVQQLKTKLFIVHVANRADGKTPDEVIQQLEEVAPVYHLIQNEDVSEGLRDYLQHSSADLLMILPHEHNLMERLFFKLHTEDIITKVKIPVITIKA